MKKQWGLLKLLRKHVVFLTSNLLQIISKRFPGCVALEEAEGQETEGWCSPWGLSFVLS